MRKFSFVLTGVIIASLICATVVEKYHGSNFTLNNFYTSWWMTGLWLVLAIVSLIVILKTKMWRRLPSFTLHLAFLLILSGALATHVWGISSRLHLKVGEITPAGVFPYDVLLEEFEIVPYPTTQTPMDYKSRFVIFDKSSGKTVRTEGQTSMNKIFRYKFWRLYQSSYDSDKKGSILSLSYDPLGIALSYSGYILLIISMISFFFQKNSSFRSLLRHPLLVRMIILPALLFAPWHQCFAEPRTVSRPIADAFGQLKVCYNDRICPMETLARDFTMKICSKSSWKGMTAEQVMLGWFFYYDSWRDEAIIKLKGEGYLTLDQALETEKASEKVNVLAMLCSGAMWKMFPYIHDDESSVQWFSLSDRLPSEIGYENWAFITGSMNYLAETIAAKDEARALEIISKTGKWQDSIINRHIPGQTFSFRLEHIYNHTGWNKVLAMFCLSLAIICFVLIAVFQYYPKGMKTGLEVVSGLILAYLLMHFILRWIITSHIPLSNGFEVMQFMAIAALGISFFLKDRSRFVGVFSILICGFSLLVSMMGESNPQITQLVPVLHSPLLSIHVSVIMLSYTLFAFMAVNGLAGIVLTFRSKRGQNSERDLQEVEYLSLISRVFLYPALFLLTAGIFIGAVWANISWGRYWGWDPKEVWALITMLIYSFAVHKSRLLSTPQSFHIFFLAAFLSVLFTYFGVNFILGGLHGYA